jgi:hypothetical protein
MMDEITFEQLAAKVAGGQASAAEESELAVLCAASSQRAILWKEIQEAFQAGRTAAALTTDHSGPELPEYRKAGLRSTVRREFRDGPYPERRFSLAWLWQGSLAAALLVVLAVFLIPTRSVVEVGVYAEDSTRGTSKGLELTASDTLKVRQFKADAELEAWLSRPFTPNEKARLWMDDAAGLIRIKIAPHWLGEGREWTHPLSNDDTERAKQIQEVLAEINSD